MINGVLTERTVSDVLPALQTNADGLKKVLEDLVKQYRSKQEEMDKWKVSSGDDSNLSDDLEQTDFFVEEEQSPSGPAVVITHDILSYDMLRLGGVRETRARLS